MASATGCQDVGRSISGLLATGVDLALHCNQSWNLTTYRRRGV